MKLTVLSLVLALCYLPALAGEPDGLTLPPGFHATVVTEGLGPVRHLAVRANGDIYVSTPKDGGGIIALHLDANHKADKIEHFSKVDGGTGIRFYNSALYASSQSGIYRFTFGGDALVPSKEPELIVDGMPVVHPGFNRVNRPVAFDGKGNLFVALDASGNFCADSLTPPGAAAPPKPVGLQPCPDLGTRAGIWRFKASKAGQKFPADGEHVATGIRDMDAIDWSPADGNLYAIMHGRDNSNRLWPDLISVEEENHISDEMHRVTLGTNFGWPYTYYDGERNLRLISPEYGGDGKKLAPSGIYSDPVLTFHDRRAAPLDLLFYSGKSFPPSYRGGAFVVLHGTGNTTGYNVVFVPFDHHGKAGPPTVFADGFAAFNTSGGTRAPAKYRPTGAAVGPDGALYICDSVKGRIWRIAWGNLPAERSTAAQ
jgi:glucose/arabinose dehydrogenase